MGEPAAPDSPDYGEAARGPVEATVERLVDPAIGSLPALRDDVAVPALRPDGTHAP